MNEQWKTAAMGALGGATLALVIVFAAGTMGVFTNRAVTEQTVHDYLLTKPELLQEMSDALTDKQARAEVAASQAAVDRLGAKAYVDPKIAFVTGPASAKTTVVEFFDYNCPYCRVSLPALKRFYGKHKNDTRFSFIEFPIKGEASVLATRALIAARRQPGKYVPFHFALMGMGDQLVDRDVVDEVAAKEGLDLAKLHADMDDPKIAQEIAMTHLLAQRSKISGTPTFIVNGRVRPGAVNDELLADMAKKRRPG
jgi:protein-disulfide isomerase